MTCYLLRLPGQNTFSMFIFESGGCLFFNIEDVYFLIWRMFIFEYARCLFYNMADK